MLIVNDLKSQLKTALSATIPPAIEAIIIQGKREKSDWDEKMAKEMAKTFDEAVSEQLADLLANAIDYYIKNATITGTLITLGGPTTQVCNLMPAPMPKLGGIIPNTLGIQ